MTVTVLFDLDDTLLENEMGVFLPAYFSKIQNSLAGIIPPEEMLPMFLAASQNMMEAQRMDRPLLDAFYEHFLASTGLSRDTIAEPIDRFYAQVYPSLRAETRPIPGAQQVVGAFADRGYRLVVATNPLFPETATVQRVDWAELPLTSSQFELITANETFHFSKPAPAYFAEVLGYLGWPEQPVVIGNDPLNDIEAASRLGLATYFVNGEASRLDGRGTRRHEQGPIEGALDWLDALSAEERKPNYRSSDAILAIDMATIAVLDTAVRRADPQEWERKDPGEWSPHQVLHHLMEVEIKVNLPRTKAVLETPGPFISGVDTDAWYADGFPALASVEETFQAFLQARQETVRLLSGLDEAGWQRSARHAIFGPTDLLEISFIVAQHDQLHIRQINRLIKPVL